jgi:carboxyl-terminal processing protease
MLKEVKENIKKNYYDPNFHGIDLEARFNAADEKLKTATSLGQIFGIIAAAVADLEDSHTRFWPPALTTRTEYGWQMQMIGNKCYVVAVKPGSDAEAKGLKPGDEVISVDGIFPTRNNLWKLNYLYYTLNPKRGMDVVVSKPDGQKRELPVLAKLTQVTVTQDLTDYDEFIKIVREIQSESKLTAHRYFENINDVFVWKMPQFDLTAANVDEMMGKVKKRKALVLDLRGNGGGAEDTLVRLIGHFFDQDVKIGDLKTRKESKPLTAKTRGTGAFKGQVVVLIDSESGSSSEVFARVMQLEKRGTVIGDHSAGAVMRSKYYSRKIGLDYVIFYGATITDADLVMTDGKSLERLGVTPDTLLLPTAIDLANLRDPVLAHAASLAGAKMEPDKAGGLFPIQWKK